MGIIITGKVIQHSGEIVPTPSLDREVGEVGLPQFMDVLEVLCSREHSEGRILHQVKILQDAVGTGFRDKMALFLGEETGNLSGGTIWMF